jgi:hypothetical protein
MTVARPVITATRMALNAVMSATVTASESWTHTGGHEVVPGFVELEVAVPA